MSWYSAYAFLLLIPLFGLIVLWFLFRRKSAQAFMRFSSLQVIKAAHRGLRSQLVYVPWVLKVLALIFVIIALARPRESMTKVKRNVEGIDIVVALDISDSMLIEDMKPENRLEASKKTIKEFIEQRVSDRIGLVVFSGESYTRVPLTLDYPVLLQNLSEVKTSKNIKMGTAIGMALANSVSRLKDSVAKSRIVIFLTDGENNSGTIDPKTAIDLAKQEGIKVYSIGMGKDGQARLPVTTVNPFGQRIKTYRPIHSKINEALLGSMAQETGGKYFRAITSNALDNVFGEINQLERTKIESNEYTKYEEKFFTWLIWALAFYFVGVLLSHSFLRRGP
ncbi:MAG: hypothetical protein CL677_07400 [Bdellovibrionaceae bacterium]|nr:hypothetical protein [Pseudobdellovibrionaceae bacterium]|tara:strand:+ start:59665 stop:60672 length:1008 start_codon:yes stop_codon:yes gene_type:complete